MNEFNAEQQIDSRMRVPTSELLSKLTDHMREYDLGHQFLKYSTYRIAKELAIRIYDEFGIEVSRFNRNLVGTAVGVRSVMHLTRTMFEMRKLLSKIYSQLPDVVDPQYRTLEDMIIEELQTHPELYSIPSLELLKNMLNAVERDSELSLAISDVEGILSVEDYKNSAFAAQKSDGSPWDADIPCGVHNRIVLGSMLKHLNRAMD